MADPKPLGDAQAAPPSPKPQPAEPLRNGDQPRFLSREGRSLAVTRGLRRHALDDLYHRWLTAPWPQVLFGVLVVYVLVNCAFALLYLSLGHDAIENARRGSFEDVFFFSVQTLATIGYGKMTPQTAAANLVVAFEALCGLVGMAMVTGLMFAKFARPTARVLWSRVLSVAPQDGVPALMFRMGNARGNQVVEAQLRFSMVRMERTVEGELVRRVHDLPLLRAHTGVFALSWLAIHRLTPQSPLWGETPESLRASGAEFVAALTGLDESFSQTIHSRHTWGADDIAWAERFEDIIGTTPDGRRVVDYSRMDATRPVPPEQRAQLAEALQVPSLK